MRYSRKAILLIFGLIFAACAGETKPSSPLETFKTYTKAIKQKDTTTMKLLLSAETIKMHELEARSQNVTVDDIVKRETLFSEGQTSVEFRNEKVEGDKATIEVKNSFGSWETVPFVQEEGNWKIDKKGYADRLTEDIEKKNNQQLDDIINKGRQP
ncbi:MAG: hypothetical protein H7070_07865 [Saprospiraceae bacterium]|nr:hypothetical protein [Pyrinomonadaceae bacterium]